MDSQGIKIKMSEDYNKSGAVQNSGGMHLLNEIANSLNEMYNTNPERFKNAEDDFVVCDLGCSLGGNSIKYFKVILDKLKEFNPQLCVKFYLEDTPSNNFEAAIQTINSGL